MTFQSTDGRRSEDALAEVTRSSRDAARAWRRLVAWERARGSAVAVLGLSLLVVLAVELAGPGLRPLLFGGLALGIFVLPLLAAASALFHRPSTAECLSELDRRSGAEDRLGTAHEFADSSSPLALPQRVDAAAQLRLIDVASAFELQGGRELRFAGWLFAALLLSAGLGFSFDPPAAESSGVLASDDAAIEDLLQSIERDRTLFDERGDKRAVELLSDLARTIREIEAREEELEQLVRERKQVETPDRAPEIASESELEPEADEEPSGLMTIAELERMEAEFIEQMRLDSAQEAELVGQLIERSSTAAGLLQELDEHIHHEHNASFQNADGMTSLPSQTSQTPFDALQSGQGLTGNRQIDQGMGNVGNPIEKDMDLHTRDLSADALIEHDATHDTQQSFNQFLKEFAGDLQDMAAEQATGRKRKKKKGDEKRHIKGHMGGEAVADKSAAMEERGFEEVGAQKRHSSPATPEDMAGLEPGDMGQPAEGAEGAGPMSSQMMAMKGPATGETSAGSSGAGKGNPSAGREGLKAMLEQMEPDDSGRVEEAISQMSRGRMSQEARERLFEQVARMEVRSGAGEEAEESDALHDYFGEADELLVAYREQLPPLFRDYARGYFNSIRPAEEAEAQESTTDKKKLKSEGP